MSITQQYDQQQFPNGYRFVDGVQMHAENGDQFQIPPDVLKRHLSNDQFVELRINSPRFSAHADAAEDCRCDSCNGEASQPILGHPEPESLHPAPDSHVPGRGWGEDFWVRITERDGPYFRAIVDNHLHESRLHQLHFGDTIAFHANHVLAIHPSHRQELVLGMNDKDLRELVDWLGQQ